MKIGLKDITKSKVALVTGTSSGIGEATAGRLAMAGYKVYGTSRRGAPAGQRSFAMLPLDVTSDGSVEAAVAEMLRLEGPVDLLVNNAGFAVAPAGAEDSSIEQAWSIFDTNFFGLVRMTRAVVPQMRRQANAAQICARQPRGCRGPKGPAARRTGNAPIKETPMLQRWRVPLITLIGWLPFVLAACTDATSSNDARMQPPLVRTKAVKISGPSERSFTGIIAARVQSDLGFRVSGKVLERLVDTGQTVRRGQPLVRIDSRDLGLAMRAQVEAVAAANARVRHTSQEESRYRDLVAKGAVSKSAYDKVRADAESARAELNAAQAQADVARNQTSYAVLLADADGVVVETLAEPGQVVAAGQVVVRVAHAGPREAIIELPETLRPAIGSTARARLYGSGLTESAQLRQLSDAANHQTRTFEARYVLTGALKDAPLGSTIAIQLSDGEHDRALQVPIGAILDSGKGAGVWLVEGETPRVTWRPVQIVRLSDEAASVVGNVKAGDRVVALGAHLLHEGEQVRLGGDAAPAVVTKAGAAP
jgi:RND family efflux transporter MFP subunit